MKLFAFAMLMASSFTSVHALDLHPAQSLTLAVPADGRFDFDNVTIPAGVILNFAAWDEAAGAQPRLSFNITRDARVAGDIIAGPYAGNDLSGQRSFRNDAGTLNIAAPGMDSFGTLIRSWNDGTQLTSIQRLNGGRLYPDLIIQQPIPEVDTWSMLLAGLGIVGLVAHQRRRRGIAASH